MSEMEAQPNRMVRYLSAAGVIGPVLYTGTWLILGFLETDYSHTQNPISDLSATGAQYAAVMTLVIILFAASIIAFALALHLGLPRGFWGGTAALVIAGIGYLGIAAAPLNLADLGEPNTLHTISATITVFALMLAPVLLLPRLKRGTQWGNLRGYSIATTILALFFAVLASLPAFADWDGLMQRLVASIVLFWIVVLAVRLYLSAAPDTT